LDPEPQESGRVGFAQVVAAQAPGTTPAERLVQDKLEGQHIRDLIPLNRSLDEGAEVHLYDLRRDGFFDGGIGGGVVGK
jgi:hypothetical protein